MSESVQSAMKIISGKLIFLLPVLLISLNLYGQGEIRAGAKLGANFNQFNQPGTSIGVMAGAFGNYEVLDYLKVQLEVLYMQQGGARINNTRDLGDIGGNISSISYYNRYVVFNNVEVPLLIKATLPDFKGEAVTPYLLLGGAYGFNAGAIEYHDRLYVFTNGDIVPISNLSENVGANYSQHQFGIIGGIGMDFNLGEKTFTTEIRYRKGVNEISNIDYSIIGQAEKIYTSSLSINFGLSIFNF